MIRRAPPPPRRTDARRLAGGALVACGVLLIGFSAAQYARGELRAAALREEWEASRAHAAVRAIRAGAFTSLASYGFEPGAPVARLQIPRLDVDEIVVEGVGVEELNVGPGHLPGTALPGEPGNSVISAHRDRHFHALAGVEVGDTVVTDVGAQRTRWVIVSRRVVKAGVPALFQTEGPTLTLTTCWPIRYFGPAPDRLIMTARPLPRDGRRERA